MKTCVKRYASREALVAAADHVHWMKRTGLRVCDVTATDTDRLELELAWVDGTSVAGDDDLVAIAVQLGQWHRRLATRELRKQTINASHRSHGVSLCGFIGPRRRILERLLPEAADHRQLANAVSSAMERSKVTVYKDANVRNVVMTAGGPCHVDPDQLGLAPGGYDLAKLLVSSAMTTGQRPGVEAALRAYNGAFGAIACDQADMAIWLELHDLLTARYVGRHYAHRWRDVRTASDGDALDRALRQAAS
jgi:hypothetical protein